MSSRERFERVRDAAIALLVESFAMSDLDEDEFEWRVGVAERAGSETELRALVADLYPAPRARIGLAEWLCIAFMLWAAYCVTRLCWFMLVR